MALPSPPFYTVFGVPNFRDVGGYPVALTSSSQDLSVRRHFLFRSAATHAITEAGEKVLRDVLGIRTIYDLRSQPEIEDHARQGRKTKKIEGVEYVHMPAFAWQDYSPESIARRYKDYGEGGAEGFTRAYDDILSHAGPSIARIFAHVRDRPDTPFLLHCSAGKDRTGVIVALVLKIAGVQDEIVAHEYSLSTQGMESMRSMLIEHMAPILKGNRDEAENRISSRKEYMLSALAMIREKYGSAEGYAIKECGLSEEDVGKVRKNMRSEVAAVL